MSYLCLFAHSGVQHILCCVFFVFVFCLVFPMLPVSPDCQFGFSNVYLLYTDIFDIGGIVDHHRLICVFIFFGYEDFMKGTTH
jgi:hypothetical protein